MPSTPQAAYPVKADLVALLQSADLDATTLDAITGGSSASELDNALNTAINKVEGKTGRFWEADTSDTDYLYTPESGGLLELRKEFKSISSITFQPKNSTAVALTADTDYFLRYRDAEGQRVIWAVEIFGTYWAGFFTLAGTGGNISGNAQGLSSLLTDSIKVTGKRGIGFVPQPVWEAVRLYAAADCYDKLLERQAAGRTTDQTGGTKTDFVKSGQGLSMTWRQQAKANLNGYRKPGL